jgi:hypothetical protein
VSNRRDSNYAFGKKLADQSPEFEPTLNFAESLDCGLMR